MCVLIFKPDSISGFFFAFSRIHQPEVNGSPILDMFSVGKADALDLPSTQGSPIIR